MKAKRFIIEAKMLLVDNNSDEKKVFNACKKAENHLTQIVSKLKSEIIDAEINLEEKQEAYKKAKFSMQWLDNPASALRDLDHAEKEVEAAEKIINDLTYSINKRQGLLDEYVMEVESPKKENNK
jgi:hypothetical protein